MMRLLSICLRILAAIFSLFPLRRRVAFLSRQGEKPSYDFERLASELRAREEAPEVVMDLSAPETQGKLRFIGHMLRQLWLARTSRVVVLDGYNPCVCIPRKRKGVYVIQLWHAVGAIKKFGLQCLDTPAGRSSADARIAHMHQNYNLVVAGGLGAVDAFAEAFGYPREQVLPLGLPRTDRLLRLAQERNINSEDRGTQKSPLDTTRSQLIDMHPWLTNGGLNILYAPTFRRGDDGSWMQKAIAELADALGDSHVNLIVSKHPLMSSREVPSPIVHTIPHVTTETLFSVVDVVISDYSAIALEACLVGLPVLFYVPDIEEYRLSPGLNVDPVDNLLLTGSPHAADIVRVISDPTELEGCTARCRSFASRYFDGLDSNSTRAVASYIFEEL